MQRLGFIHDMMDVKVLILFVTSRSSFPLTTQEIYELCYQDECLSYFDVCTAVPEMVNSGHLEQVEEEKFVVTVKGRETAGLTEDSIAFTVRQRAENAVARSNRQIRRSSLIKTHITPRENGDYSVVMSLDDEVGNLVTLELMAPDQRQAVRLSRLFENKAEDVYNMIMTVLLDSDGEEE